jgi:hypothetical protein
MPMTMAKMLKLFRRGLKPKWAQTQAPRGRVALESKIVLPSGRSFKVLRKDVFDLTPKKAA